MLTSPSSNSTGDRQARACRGDGQDLSGGRQGLAHAPCHRPAKASLADTLILKGRLDEARDLIEDARGAFRSSKTSSG
jgi:hypothetical protein